MELDKITQGKIKELQAIENNINGLLMQKQAFQMELNESEGALAEVMGSTDDIYKLAGNILVKAKKEKVEGDLKRKIELLTMRLKSIEKQEEELSKEVEKIRSVVLKKIK